jgi:PAS domain S-box-containing protein
MSLTVRVVAPTGRDAELTVSVLLRHGIIAEVCRDALELLDAASHEPLGPLLIAEESLTAVVRRRLSELVQHQPAWSDFPILILTNGGGDRRRGQQLESEHLALGSPILLERPLRTESLVSSLRAAVRARMRQYEVRDAMLARDQVLQELRVERDTLRLSEERFRRLIENASVCINISDLEGGISYANPALLRLIGFSAEEVRQGLVRWEELTPPEFAEADRRATQQLLETGTCVPYQKLYRARDGRLIPLLVGMTMLSSSHSANGKHEAAVFLTDLTSQKQAESALIQSEKLAAVGRLAASISHEINNPLEAVTNILYLLRSDRELDHATQKHLSTAEGELARVSQIVTQTLRFHRQSSAPREISPAELIDSVISLYHGRLQNSQIRIVYQLRTAAPIVCYDGDVRQVLSNLVGNAIDAMRGGGRMIIRTQEVTLWRTGQPGLRITIADTGHGMSAAVRANIFEPFYTTKGSSGNGLGLWISKGIMEKHRGLLRVRSSDVPGRSGSLFSLFLPREAALRSPEMDTAEVEEVSRATAGAFRTHSESAPPHRHGPVAYPAEACRPGE